MSEILKGWTPAAEDEVVIIQPPPVDLFNPPVFKQSPFGKEKVRLDNPPIPLSFADLKSNDYIGRNECLRRGKEAYSEGFMYALELAWQILEETGSHLICNQLSRRMRVKLRRNGKMDSTI